MITKTLVVGCIETETIIDHPAFNKKPIQMQRIDQSWSTSEVWNYPLPSIDIPIFCTVNKTEII